MLVVVAPQCGQRNGLVIAMRRRIPVMMKGKSSLGIFLVPSTAPWFSHLPGLVCTLALLLLVMAISLSR